MRIRLKALNNRVARRIFLLFLLVAIVPLIILSSLTLYQVKNELRSQSEVQLRGQAKSLGMEIFTRLEFYEEELRLLAQHIRQQRRQRVPLSFDELGISETNQVTSLFVLNTEGEGQPLVGNIPIEGRRLIETIHNERVPGKPLLLLHRTSQRNGQLQLLLFLPVEPGRIDSDLLGALFNIDTLWDSQQLQDRPELVCILSEDDKPLYCNRQAPVAWLAAAAQNTRANANGQFVWRGEGEPQLTAYWSLFLEPHYQLNHWMIVFSLPESDAMLTVAYFQQQLPRVVLFTLLVVILFSIPVIRSSMRPLELLLEATRALSRGEFGARVSLASKDEFQEVGESFNQMARQLGRQFEQQKLLTYLGKELQQAESVDAAIQAVFVSLKRLPITAAVAAICFENHKGSVLGRCYSFWHEKVLESTFDRESVLQLPAVYWEGSTEEMEHLHPSLRILQAHQSWRITMVPVTKDGDLHAMLAIANDGGQALDATWRKFLEQLAEIFAFALVGIYLDKKLIFQVHHDPLTDLPNRLLLKQRTEQVLRESQQSGEGCALVIFDIDRFKTINDTQGHAAGDELLIHVAERLRHCFRREDLLCRFAGDEFVVLLSGVEQNVLKSSCYNALDHIDSIFNEPFRIGNSTLRVTASKGVACYPWDGDTFLDLLKNADAAMYHAKARQPGSTAFFSIALQESLSHRISTERALVGAVDRNEFFLHYQPVVDMALNRVIATEALIRWQPPDGKLVMPGDFISIAEEIGVIEEIGYWAMEQACADFQRWTDRGVRLDHVAVNVSSHQLQNADFVACVESVLERSGIDPRYLELEMTESVLIENFEQSANRLQKLRAKGIRIAVDDFGTGYSSMKYLKILQVDRLKVDRFFIRELPENTKDRAIISSLATLCQELGLSITAEGVETEEQLEFLKGLSVTEIQGFYFSKPLPETAFLDYVARINRRPLQLLRGNRL